MESNLVFFFFLFLVSILSPSSKKVRKIFMKFQYFLHCIFVIPQLFFYKSYPSSVLKKLQQVLSLLISNLLDKTTKKQSYMKVYHKNLWMFDKLWQSFSLAS
jgi:hypothetical protein